ncbi:hypothetical protein FRC09_001807 [Ceratobasidium sp. 395]|nr:hypothetical protein FRC09_001807 [Ceratobasidium sp. 395]
MPQATPIGLVEAEAIPRDPRRIDRIPTGPRPIGRTFTALLRQRMSREIVTRVPVPSESEAIGWATMGETTSTSADASTNTSVSHSKSSPVSSIDESISSPPKPALSLPLPPARTVRPLLVPPSLSPLTSPGLTEHEHAPALAPRVSQHALQVLPAEPREAGVRLESVAGQVQEHARASSATPAPPPTPTHSRSRPPRRSTPAACPTMAGCRDSREYDDSWSAGYDDGHSAGYDDAHSAGYDDARTYDDGRESGSRAYRDETYRSKTQTGYPQSEAQIYARSETHAPSRARSDDAHTQYSTEDGTDATSSVSPEEILALLHQMTLDPVNFERKVLSTVEEQTERSSSQLSRTSSLRQGPGSDISRGTRRSGSHIRGSSDGGSLFSPSTHGSYLSPGGPGTTQPLSLFLPLLPPKTTEPSPLGGLKEKESIKSLNRHPSASMGRRAGELIAFFESGASGTGRPVSPTKSDASFVSAASGAGAAAAIKPRSSNDSGSFGLMASPGKMSTSLSTFTRTFTGTGGSGSASGSAVGSGSYTGSGSDLGSGSIVSSPFARSRGTGVGLGFDALFSPSFPAARAGSPFRPASPTKSVASGASGSYVSGTHKEDAASETYRTGGSRSDTARSETNRSDTYRSETNRSDTYRSETNQSGTYRSETNQSGTYRSNGSDTYRSNGSDAYRSGTGASKSVTVRSAGGDAYCPGGSNGSVRSRLVASESYRSGPGTYTGTGTDSDTYRAGSGSGRSRSVASESYNSDTYMTGTGSDTYRAGGSDAGVCGFLSSMYPRGSDSGMQTMTGSRAGSHGCSESGFSQGRSYGGFSQ